MKDTSKLTPLQFQVTQQKGTEAPGTGALLHNKESGDYHCIVCNQLLFKSNTKFDSGSGWPSFYDPANKEFVNTTPDSSHGMNRTEVTCKNCGAHLGHLFDDGPEDKTGLRYCINSAALAFSPKTPDKT
jgi:peptide-methionine (R)-S-oxide reductase